MFALFFGIIMAKLIKKILVWAYKLYIMGFIAADVFKFCTL